LPALVFGLVEDLSKRVSARHRLMATLASGLLICHLYGTGLNRVDVWGVDALLNYWPVSFLFTAFAVAGLANAINIIDGFNGLASGAVLISLAALGLIAYQVGDHDVTMLCLILAAATGGFMVVNFPLGKIFLGDGGAYLMGFMLAWTSVLLLLRNPGVSVWAPLMACGYPVTEVIFSIWRRRQHDMHPFSPDSLHLHSLVKVRIVLQRFHHWRPEFRNALVSPVMWTFAALPAAAGAAFFRHTPWLLVCGALSVAVYFVAYRALERRKAVRHAKTFELHAKMSRKANRASHAKAEQARSTY
jgi:UDP-N-acetylmuramyl pentapeptide phosphotransferase/UDP-N-acetylglucosamine-1-phosphate transferase